MNLKFCSFFLSQAHGDEFDTSLFEQPGFREVFRSLNVKLCVAGTEEDPLHPTRPVIHFFGEMHDPSTSTTMTGWVKMTTDRQVRWHFVSFFIWEMRRLSSLFRFLGIRGMLFGGILLIVLLVVLIRIFYFVFFGSSEGVQVGGLRSAFGVLGSWTTIFHDADDPVGKWANLQFNGVFQRES